MSECGHKNSIKKDVTLDYFGLKFKTSMDVCDSCQAQLWTPETRDRVNRWLTEQKSKHRDNFIIQSVISNRALDCLKEIAKKHPGTTNSDLIRALTLVFLFFMEDPSKSEIFESISDTRVFSGFVEDSKQAVKVQFSPIGMMDVYSWSKILDLKPAKLVEEAVYRITSFCVENDPNLKKFWENTILPQLSLILKAS